MPSQGPPANGASLDRFLISCISTEVAEKTAPTWMTIWAICKKNGCCQTPKMGRFWKKIGQNYLKFKLKINKKKHWKRFKKNKKVENGWKKVFQTAFGCALYPKAGWNTQQPVRQHFWNCPWFWLRPYQLRWDSFKNDMPHDRPVTSFISFVTFWRRRSTPTCVAHSRMDRCGIWKNNTNCNKTRQSTTQTMSLTILLNFT